MFKFYVSIVAFSIAFWSESHALSHPGHSHEKGEVATTKNERLWLEKSGSTSVRGSFVSVKDDFVQIQKKDESLVSMKLSQLFESDQRWVEQRMAEIRKANEMTREFNLGIAIEDPQMIFPKQQREIQLLGVENVLAAEQLPVLLAQIEESKSNSGGDKTPEMAKAFAAFVQLKAIQTRWDDRFFYVESKGMPDHQKMVGITAWQQQVPLPQSYFADNAWRIPLFPVPAQKPMSARNNFMRGAIALAANGVPIFNPLNNRGEDSYQIGELDEFGGHCGRADDYHYHIAPVHLQKQVGKGLPIAYALDGYPIYGYEEPDGSEVKGLDAFNGHKDANGQYHYHASKKYPYLNGGFYGEVTERDGQVDPQPRANSVRPAGQPLREAKISDFVETKPGSYRLSYEVRGKKNSIEYTVSENGSVDFSFVDASGQTRKETYSANRRGAGAGPASGPGGKDRQPPPRPDTQRPKGKGPPPRDDARAKENARPVEPSKSSSSTSKLIVTSPAFEPNGMIPVEFTCDGASASPPIEWKDAPEGTKFFALSLWHTAPDQEKSYWLVYNIPASVTKLEKNEKRIGIVGLNDKRKAAYDPMCSKGPGLKKYHITVYALSAEPKMSSDSANRANLLAAIKDLTLAESTLDFQYERKK